MQLDTATGPVVVTEMLKELLLELMYVITKRFPTQVPWRL